MKSQISNLKFASKSRIRNSESRAKPAPPADFWSALDAARAETLSVAPPPGAFTVRQYAERYGHPYSTAKCQMQRLVASDVVIDLGAFGSHAHWYRLRPAKPERPPNRIRP